MEASTMNAKQDPLFDLSGQVALITGGASGLGFQMAETMAEHGASVVLLDADGPGLETAVAILARSGSTVEGHRVDVTEPDAVRSAIDRAAAKHGRLDIVFANAGINAGPGIVRPEGQIDAVDLDQWHKVMAINLTGAMLTLQAAARHMKTQRRGRIILTSSIAGLQAQAQLGYAYAASKAGVAAITRLAALELAPFNVMVNAIAPGPFMTNISGGRLKQPEIAEMLGRIVPIGRVAQPNEVRGLALLLASPASSFITGTVIPIDGGITAG
jgi:NAD(P)-dependent dehydrogenase (short-subunit alcohol dehydrogenase family)